MRIGIDLGGSKIELVALDDAGATLHRERIATPTGDYAATIEAIAALVERAERAIGGQVSVGIGTPGSRSPATGRMRNANSTCLNGRALDRDLATRLSLLMGIHKGLRYLFSDPARGYGWIRKANRMLAGKSPLEIMVQGDIFSLARVRSYLDAERGGW